MLKINFLKRNDILKLIKIIKKEKPIYILVALYVWLTKIGIFHKNTLISMF